MPNRRAYHVYLIYSCLASAFFAITATFNLVYHAAVIGLNPLQMVLVGTVLETTVFVFEVPTGIVADVYSRRLSIIVGVFLIGLGFTIEGSIPAFWAVLLSQVIWGIGATFTSGATEAWITDEVGEQAAGRVFLRGGQMATLGGLTGVVAGTAMANVAVHVPVVVGGLLHMALAVLLIAIMPETGFQPAPRAERTTWQQMAHQFRQGIGAVRGRPLLILLLAVGAFWGIASEGYDRLWQKLLVDDFALPAVGHLDAVTWFGILAALGTPLYLATSEIVRRRVDLNNTRALARLLLALNALIVGAMVALAVTSALPVALGAVLAIGTLRGVNGPLYATWVNRQIDSRVRATVLSAASQSDAIGQIAGGPAVGYVGLRAGTRAAIFVAGLLLSPILLLYAVAARRRGGAGAAQTG